MSCNHGATGRTESKNLAECLHWKECNTPIWEGPEAIIKGRAHAIETGHCVRLEWKHASVLAMTTRAPITWRDVPCSTCGEQVTWIECPTGGWWAHREQTPDDHHAAVPVVFLRITDPLVVNP